VQKKDEIKTTQTKGNKTMGMSIEYSMGRIGSEDTFLDLADAVKLGKKIVGNYISEVEDEDGKYAIDDYSWHVVTADTFEADWINDERLGKADEIKAKYKKLTENNRVFLLEVDWN